MDSLTRRLLLALGTVAVLGLPFLWRWMKGRRGRAADSHAGLPMPSPGERLVLTEDIRKGQTGCVSYKGSVWSARNVSPRDLKEGEVSQIERVEPDHTLVVSASGGVVEKH